MKYIFTIATNVYTEYFNNFKNSINNFYPDDDKTLIVFSNKLQEYNNYQIRKTLVKIISIPNLLYTSINLNKFNFIEWISKKYGLNENTLIFFFDIDTWFYDNNKFALDNLNNIIETNKDKVIFSNHPYNLNIKQNELPMYIHGYINNENYMDPIEPKIFDNYSFAKYDLWCKDCITSFFCGTLKAIKELNIVFTNYYKEIIHSDRVIPQICEEDIVNYILLNQLINEIDKEYIYVTDDSIININTNNINDKTITDDNERNILVYNKLICNQKYNVNIKSKVK